MYSLSPSGCFQKLALRFDNLKRKPLCATDLARPLLVSSSQSQLLFSGTVTQDRHTDGGGSVMRLTRVRALVMSQLRCREHLLPQKWPLCCCSQKLTLVKYPNSTHSPLLRLPLTPSLAFEQVSSTCCIPSLTCHPLLHPGPLASTQPPKCH